MAEPDKADNTLLLILILILILIRILILTLTLILMLILICDPARSTCVMFGVMGSSSRAKAFGRAVSPVSLANRSVGVWRLLL